MTRAAVLHSIPGDLTTEDIEVGKPGGYVQLKKGEAARSVILF